MSSTYLYPLVSIGPSIKSQKRLFGNLYKKYIDFLIEILYKYWQIFTKTVHKQKMKNIPH